MSRSRAYLARISAILFVILVGGCEAVNRAPAARLASDHTPLIRAAVLDARELNPVERHAVLTSEPTIGQYVLAATFAQTKWKWRLPSGRTIEAWYTGELAEPILKDAVRIKVEGD